MTVGELLKAGGWLDRSEKELLLAHALETTRETVLAHPEHVVKPVILRKYRRLLRRRVTGEPYAYITGQNWFFGRAFKVSPATLIPRSSTETLVEAALAAAGLTGGLTLLDIGTGSGAIAVTLAAERPSAQVLAIDVSSAALRIAKQNARSLGAKVLFFRRDILKPGALKRLPIRSRLVIAANLPYLKDGIWKKLGVGIRKFEPRLALTSGRDGLNHYRALMKRIKEAGLAPDALLLEADPPQFPALKKIVQSVLPKYRFEIRKDLYGDRRVLIAKA